MPFNRPTLQENIGQIEADLKSRLTGLDVNLRRSIHEIFTRVVAAAKFSLEQHLDWISKQVLPDTAEAEFLERHAAIQGISRKSPSKSTGTVTLSGTDGVIVPDGLEMQRIDGTLFVTTETKTISAGSASVSVATKTAGSTGNLDTCDTITVITPISGLDGTVTVDSPGLSGGVDPEDDDSLLDRLLQQIQSLPHGGNANDYIKWAKDVAGVTRAWVYPLEDGAGTVTVRFVMDDKAGTIIPDIGEVATVQSHIDDLRPVTAAVTVAAPTPVNLDLTLAVTPDTQAVRDAVQAELEDMLRRDAAPGGTILISHIREAISITAGEIDYTLSSSTADVTHGTSEIAVMGTITWL